MDSIYSVKIAGLEIKIVSSESMEYTQKIAAMVDARIQEMSGNNTVSITTSAILAAMSYCDDIQNLTTGNENMRTQLKSYLADTNKALAERDEARRMTEKLKDELMRVKIDMSNKKD